MKMYIAVLDIVPNHMVPVLVAHSTLGAHLHFYNQGTTEYLDWLYNHFKKVVVRVNQKEFDKIKNLENVYLGHENSTLDGVKSCAVVHPLDELPNVLKFAKLWKPLND